MVLLWTCPSCVYAYDFVPTDAEWIAWPDYCKARYITLPVGENTKWASELSAVNVVLARKKIGEDTFTHVHHYCAGVTWLNRANQEVVSSERLKFYRNAISEISYVLERVDHRQPIASGIIIKIAQAYEGINELSIAEKFYREAVDLHKDNGSAYASLANFLRKNKRFNEAKKILLDGDFLTEETSMDINIVMAHLLIDMGDNVQAAVYAKKGYKMGYPLPGLKKKLEDLKLWSE